MKRAFAVLLATTAIAGVADAADLNSGLKDQKYVAEAPIGWTGFYFGVNGGYGQGLSSRDATLTSHSSYTILDEAPKNSETINFSQWPGTYTSDSSGALSGADPSGGLYGIQGGYLFQSGSIVFGLEASFDGSSVSGHKSSMPTFSGTDKYAYTGSDFTFTSTTTGDFTGSITAHQQLNYLADLTFKVGLPLGNGLVYLKAGGAMGEVQTSVTGADGFALSRTSTDSGWTAGGGVAYKITPAISAFAEYNYYELEGGSINGSILRDIGATTTFTSTPTSASASTAIKTTPVNLSISKMSEDFSVVKFGLNYHTGSGYTPLK